MFSFLNFQIKLLVEKSYGFELQLQARVHEALIFALRETPPTPPVGTW